MKLRLEYYYFCQNPTCTKYMRMLKGKRVCDYCGYDTKRFDGLGMPIKTENGFTHRLKERLNGARM